MDQSFGFTPSDAVFHYHSIYDSQHWQEQYADPGFHRHVSLDWTKRAAKITLIGAQIAVAKHLGLMTLRLTDAIILPLNTTQYVLELHEYLDQSVISLSSLFLSTHLRRGLTGLRTSRLRPRLVSTSLI
jgi:N-acetylated-alpha-linked acidic dipeptidase